MGAVVVVVGDRLPSGGPLLRLPPSIDKKTLLSTNCCADMVQNPPTILLQSKFRKPRGVCGLSSKEKPQRYIPALGGHILIIPRVTLTN